MAAAGLYTFHRSKSPSIRAGSLGLLFPGAGLVAVATIPSILAFVVSTALIPLVLFAWFGAGGVLFPILLWAGTSGLAAFLARDSVLDIAGPVWAVICVLGITWLTIKTQSANSEARAKRQKRNEYLVESVKSAQAAGYKHAPGSRELDLRTLKFVQWFVELGLSKKDDFSYHDIIDQFQTSAIRYQLYEAVSSLGVYQYIYAPNFHGYVSQAMRNTIEKSLCEKVVGFWKWESIWGKFNVTNWDPIIKDNIMVSGYVLQAVGIYQSNTRDERYLKPGSLTFEIDKSHTFPYDFKGIADSVKRNWDEGDYCLFPCEPNWM
jgi:Linalool dehydratase/isomerase